MRCRVRKVSTLYRIYRIDDHIREQIENMFSTSSEKFCGTKEQYALNVFVIGMAIVLGSVLGGYLMEQGNIYLLIQPADCLLFSAPPWAVL